MNWLQGGKYFLESDGAVKYTIAKVYVDGRAFYELWCAKHLRSIHDSAKEAMQAAEMPYKHENGDGV